MENVRKKYEEEGFLKDQIDEIEIGIQKGLNISYYAKKEFLAIQMRQIRLGLEENLDAVKYAKPEYDWFQMEEIREGLKAGLDISKYADPRMSYEIMREIRKGLAEGIDLPYRKGWSAGVLRELRKALLAKVNIIKYIREGYKEEQLGEIRKAIENGIDIDPYISVNYNGACIQEIVKGLESKLDVSVYAKQCYSWQQMREIRRGLKNRVNIEFYSNVLFNWRQMREIRLGLEEGIQVSSYATLMYTEKEMVQKRNQLSEVYLDKPAKAEEYVKKAVSTSEEHGFVINVSKDEMEAVLVFNNGSRQIDKETLFTHLFRAGVTYGIQEDATNAVIKGIWKAESIVIARGTQEERGVDGRYEFFFRTQLDKKPVILDDGSVDYKNIDWLESVKKNQKIAYYHEAQDGKEGKTVTGKSIPSRKGKELRMLAGKGFELLEDRKTYVAAKTGKIEIVDERIIITDVLELDDVTISTGNIQFDGSVHIHGNVGKGVSISASKDIIVEGFVEAADLSAEGDIILKKGCNASGQGKIKSGNDVMARFLEGARIHAKGNVKINYCMNCEIHAEDKIEVSGMMVGGSAYAGGGVDVSDLGNDTGVKTLVKVGQNADFMERERALDDKISEVGKELELLKKSFEDFQRRYSVEIRNTNTLYLKLEEAIYTKNQELDKLMEVKADMNKCKQRFDKARIVIRGTIYEGCRIDIGGAMWRAKEMTRVTLQKDGDRVSVSN